MRSSGTNHNTYEKKKFKKNQIKKTKDENKMKTKPKKTKCDSINKKISKKQ